MNRGSGNLNRLRVLSILPGLIPSTIIGIIKPLLKLEQSGGFLFQVRLNKKVKLSVIDDFDVVVFCRNCEFEDLKYLYYAKSKGKKVIYEIDDNVFDISTEGELGKFHRYPGRLYVVKRFLELADLIHVYSNPLFEISSKYNPNIKKINSYFDFSLIEGMDDNYKKTDRIKIVYATSRQDNDTLAKTFEDALLLNLDKFRDEVELYVFGEIPVKLRNKENIKKLPYIRDYNKFIQFFYKQGFHIGLAPLKDDIFHRSKTNNKFREYGACGVAGIYSNIDVYTDCIQNHETGIIVNNNTEEWAAAIETLITDSNLREKIATNARNKVKQDYSFEYSLETWKDSINQVTQLPLKDEKYVFLEKRRILLLVQKDYENVTSRIQATSEALVFMNLKYDVMYLEELKDEKILQNYNMVIVFISKMSNFNLSMFDINTPLIVDCTQLDSIAEEILIVTPDGDTDKKKLVIDSYTKFDEKKKYTLQELIEYTQGISIQESILYGNTSALTAINIDKWIQKAPEIIERNVTNYYSINSSVVKWMELIQKELEKHSYSSPSFIKRVYKKIAAKIRQKFVPFDNKFKILKNRYELSLMLYQINKKGKRK